MKRWLLLTLLAITISAGAWAAFRSRAPKPQSLDIHFTCDVRGRLVPCGCFTGQMGGLTRIATLISPSRGEGVLKVDIGDAIEGPEDYHQIEHRYILKAFERMGYDAANLGHGEARLNAAQLRELKTQSAVPLLSANLLDAATSQPIFDTYRIVKRGNWRIALVGAMSAEGVRNTLGEGLRVEPIETALGRLLPTLKTEADFIVLLAFADEEEMRRLARDFYELDVILGGKVSQPSQQIEKQNRSLILATTNQSRALGSLTVELLERGKLEAKDGGVTLVHDMIAEAPEIQWLADEYRAEVRRTKLDIDDPERLQQDLVPGIKAVAEYIGSETCLTCHPNAAHKWQTSAHAHAFKTLVHRGADADPNCIGCHTVGFGTSSGYRREFKETRLTNVGCESCHGPGSLHVAQRSAGGAVTANFRPLGAGDCQTCHHGEFSRPFDWDKFWPKIQHGREAAGTVSR